MSDEEKTKEQLIEELRELRHQMFEKGSTSGNIKDDLIENIPISVALYKMDGTIYYVNDEFERGIGRKREELIGKTPLQAGFVTKEEHDKIEKDVFPDLIKKGFFYGYESTAIRKNGESFPILMNWKLIKDNEGRPKNIIVTATDIIKQKMSEEKVINQSKELQAYSRIFKKLLQTFDLEDRLNLILNEAVNLTGVEYGVIFLTRGNNIILSAWKGISEEIRARMLSFPRDNFPDWLIKYKIIHEKLSEHGKIPDFAKHEGIQSKASIPLYIKNNGNKELIGAIMLASQRYNALGESEIRMFESMSDQLALAIDHNRHYREAKERLSRLEVLREIDRLIINHLDISYILDVVLTNIPKELGAGAVAISLIDNNKNTRVFSMRLPNGTFIHKEAFSIADSLMHWYIDKKEPIIIYNLSDDPRIQMHKRYIYSHKLVSYLGVPMVAQEKTIGILHLITTEPKVFLDEDITFFRTLAGQAAIALKSAELLKNTIESEKRYRSIFENAAEGIYQANLKGKILLSNSQMAYMLGYKSSDEFLSKIDNINKLYANPSDRAEFIRILKDKKTVENFETQMHRRDGGIIWISKTAHLIQKEDGETLYYEVICTDITARKKAELALKESEEKYRTLVEQSNEGICIIQNGRFEYLNPSLAKMWGGTVEDFRGRSFKDFLQSEEASKIFEYYKRRMAGEHIPQYELMAKRKDGSDLFVDIKGSLINYKGKPAELVMIRDITDKKKAEKEQEKLRRQFIQAQKMEAIGRLTGSIAHDFNNMLTAILGYSDLLLLKLESGNPIKEYIEEIKKAGIRATELTGRLLAFSRKQVLQKRIVNVNEIINNVESMLRRLIGENIKLINLLEPDLNAVKADGGQIEQVIMNLIVNAKDAMPKGGTIKIKTENVSISDEYCNVHTYANPGQFVCISVEDTGTGMDEETKAHIFEPFFTTKESGRGTGLGLAASFGIIKQHEGWIDVYSKPNKGSIFKIYIPAYPVKVEGTTFKEEKDIQLMELKGKGEHILFVEDDEDVLSFSTTLLKENGYIVYGSKNSAEALRIFKEKKGKFDLVFCDITLPDGNGIELTDKFLKLNPKLSIILSSGYLDNESKLDYIRDKGLKFLKKPFTATELLRTVKKSIADG